MRIALVISFVLLLGSSARADVVTQTGAIDGLALDMFDEPLAGATVRIVGDALVMTLHAGNEGTIHATHLPPGSYRIEVDGGHFAPPTPSRTIVDVDPRAQRPIRWDRAIIRCCLCAMYHRELVAAPPAERPFIDTTSTALVTRFGPRDF